AVWIDDDLRAFAGGGDGLERRQLRRVVQYAVSLDEQVDVRAVGVRIVLERNAGVDDELVGATVSREGEAIDLGAGDFTLQRIANPELQRAAAGVDLHHIVDGRADERHRREHAAQLQRLDLPSSTGP